MLGGKLADTLGHRRMLYVGVTGFAVCSALCGATPTGSGGEAWIICFRVAQGAFAALLFPAALAIVTAAFPREQRGRRGGGLPPRRGPAGLRAAGGREGARPGTTQRRAVDREITNATFRAGAALRRVAGRPQSSFDGAPAMRSPTRRCALTSGRSSAKRRRARSSFSPL